MDKSDYKLIDNALNNKLDSESLKDFNQKLRDNTFRKSYLDYMLDERLLAIRLEQKFQDIPRNKNEEQSTIFYDSLNDNLDKESFKELNQDLHEEQTRTEFIDFMLDEKLLEAALNKKSLENTVKKRNYSKIILPSLIAIAAMIMIVFLLPKKAGIATVERAYNAYLIQSDRRIKISKAYSFKDGDHIIVDGTLTLEYPDKSAVIVNNGSEFIIKFNEGNENTIELLKGSLTANYLAQSKPIELLTNKSKVIVSDSTFTLSITNKLSSIEVHRGDVEFFNSNGQKNLVKEGQLAWANKDKGVLVKAVHIDNENEQFTY